MNPLHQIEKLAKFAAYILGRHPDEFGLVLDSDGFVAIREFLKAVNELEGWKHIRQHHIHEIILSSRTQTIEIHDRLIRARQRQALPLPVYCPSPPKLLYLCVRHKSYSALMEHGIRPTWHASVICSSNKESAEKIGRRRDPQPVLLTIHTLKSMEKGVAFHQYGDALFLADFIPPDCFTGPPLPKEKPRDGRTDPVETFLKQTRAGSFEWKPEPAGFKKTDNKKGANWKKDKKRLRREKKNFWPE